MGKVVDISGKIYNRLTVISFDHMKGTKSYWKCKCECGNETIVRKDLLSRTDGSGVKSCGCLNTEVRRKQIKVLIENNKTSLGHSNKDSEYYRLYDIFCGMKERCNDPLNIAYKYYGEKGIIVEWTSYVDFFNDMKESYNEHVKQFGVKQTTIDRINSNKNYSKDNCRWATYKEQVHNRG